MKKKILLLGSTGYIGSAIENEIKRRSLQLITLTRSKLDYTKFRTLLEFLKSQKPDYVINAAGYTGKPNVDACELNKADTLVGNTLLPQTIAHACEVAKISWGHISSGCIYSGAKIFDKGCERVEKDLTKPELKEFISNRADAVRGFSELDPPNFTFRNEPCSFYSGSKALAEELLAEYSSHYIFRLRIPFDEMNSPRNYITKLLTYDKVYDNFNSLTHRGHFARAILDVFQNEVPCGVYNVTNPGFVSSKQVVNMIKTIIKPTKLFEFWNNDKEFYKEQDRTPRSNCILDVSKLASTGIKLINVEEALEEALINWSTTRNN